MNKSDVTIIIPHFFINESEKALDICLESLFLSGFPMKNVIIAHNGVSNFSSWGDDEGDNSFKEYKTLMIEDQGQCKAVNAAVATVNTPWVMVTNNDMVYSKNWFERLTNNMEDAVCISPQLIEPRPGAPTFKTVFFGGLGGDWQPQKFFDYCDNHIGEGVRTGFNLPFLIKKEVWDLVGGYDVNYDPFGSNSDSDLEYKLKLAGVQPMQNTDCPVYHFSQTSGTFEPKNQGYWSENWDYFIKKWGFPRTDSGIWEANFEIPKENIFHPYWEGHYAH